MALLSGFDRIESSNNTFSDWLNKTNEMIDLFRDNAVTANSSGANTDGNVRINGEFVSNTLIAFDELRGGDLFDGNSAQLNVTSNTVFTSNADFVRIENDLFVEGDAQVSSNLTVNTDSLFVGDVEAQSTVEFTEGDTRLVFSGANQDFVSETSNTYASIRTTDDGSLLFNADKTGVSNNQSIIELQANTLTLAQFAEGGDVAFYSANGSTQKLYWDATNITLGVNTASPQDNVALDVVGNTHTTDLNVAHQITTGNVVVDNELRGNNETIYSGETLFVTTNAEVTNAQVLIRNDMFVEGDAQVTSNLTVNTDSTFVGDVEVQSDLLLIGNVEAQTTIEFTKGVSTLEFAGANQTFIWDTSNTQSTIRTNANGSLIIDADKTNDGANTSRIDLRVDNKTSVRIEDNHVAFYNQAGTAKRLYWDAENLVLGVNTASPQDNVALDVVGDIHTTDLFVEDELTANIVTIDSELRSSANLVISSNVVAEANLSVEGTLSISTANLDYLLVPDNYNDLIPNQPSGRLLGNTTNRWDGYFNSGDFSANVEVGDTLTTDTLVVTNAASLPSTLTFTGETTFEDITVSGVASFANLEVQSLTTNSAGLVGTGGSVTTTSPTVIDQFDKSVSRGFKYVIHGENNDATSAYAIEINCSHNDTDVFFTRFGEVSNNFDAVIVPQVNGGNIELIATCSSASVSNTHSFNMVRIETR